MNCEVSQKCGSCSFIEMEYEKQLIKKHEQCEKLFSPFNVHIHPVEGMKSPFAYRNKVIVSFNQKYEYGLFEESSHKIVPMKKCLLHDDETHQILQKIQSLFKKYRISLYDEKRHKGFLKYVLIRRAIETNQTLVCLVTNDDVFKGSKNFCNELIKVCPTVKTIVMNINKRQTSIVLSSQEKILYGKGFIVDYLCGLSFKISAQSFYQINHEQCTQLYNKVIELLNPQMSDVILDTYCGIGTIGMVAAKYASQVIGVEMNLQAYKDAMNNATMNKIKNIRFMHDDATEFMKKIASNNQRIDCVIMDPPRGGSTKEFVDAIHILKPKSVVYVSCDPSTQVRDLSYFKKIGYVCKDVYLYDMFPHTSHIEVIIRLSRAK